MNRLAGIPERIQEIVSQAAHTHYGNMECKGTPLCVNLSCMGIMLNNIDTFNLLDIMMLRAGVQALSNLLTGNEASKDSIWSSLLVQRPSSSCDENLLR